MKKFFYSVFAICVCLFITTLASGTELKFTTQEFAPFSYKIDGIVSGPAVDIIKKICKDMKVNCSFKLTSWTRAQKMVKEGSANGLFVIGWNKDRDKWLYFSPPILNTEYGFFVRNDNPLHFKELSDITGYSISAYGPSNTSKSLKKLKALKKDIKIEILHQDENCFRRLSKKKVTAVYSNRDVGFALIKKLKLKNIRYAGAQKKLKYYIGFSKKYNDKKIVDKFDATFLDLYKEGIIQNILKKHFMEPAKIK